MLQSGNGAWFTPQTGWAVCWSCIHVRCVCVPHACSPCACFICMVLIMVVVMSLCFQVGVDNVVVGIHLS